MKGKKGYIKILEAGIAGLLLLGFIYLVTLPTYVKKTSLEDEVYKSVTNVLDEIERNGTLREKIFGGAEDRKAVYFFVRSELEKKQLDGNISVCRLGDFCPAPPNLPDKDIFVRERVIATTPINDSKKVAVHAWTRF